MLCSRLPGRLLAVLVVASITSSATASRTLAQSGPQRQQQQILQQQEQRQRAQDRQLRRVAPPAAGENTPEPGPSGPVPGRCIRIDKIIIDGAPLLPDEERAKANQTYRGKCLSLLEINEILRDVTNWYVDAGYVTTRAYLPEQALGDGDLTIKVLEGRVAGVALNENGVARTGRNMALPNLQGERLNIRDVEQGLDQISRLQSFNPTVRLQPGREDGFTDVVIDAKRGRSWRASATYDNFGIPSTGRRVLGASAEVDDLLGLYDFLAISVAGSDSEQSYFKPQDANSQSFSAYYAVPFGYWTASISSSYFKYETPIMARFEELESSGETLNHRAEVQRVVHRDQSSKTFVAFGLTSKTIRNYIDDSLLEVSSHRLSTAGVRLSHVRSQWGGVLSLTGTVDRGLAILGAKHDRGAADGEPRAEFTRGTIEASFVRPFEFASQKLQFSSSIVASASPDTLYATERLSAGGRYTVRGFLDDSISGDTGAYTRNELIWSLPPSGHPDFSRLLGHIDVFVGVDAGWVKTDRSEPFEGGHVLGVAGGARFGRGAVFGEVSAEKALDAPDWIDRDDVIVGFRVGVTTDGF